MKLNKVVFPVAGLGSRFFPATKATPKEMLPIVDKPLIQYAVEEALDAGFTELIFVTAKSKTSIRDHFDGKLNTELSNLTKEKKELLSKMNEIIPKSVSCKYVFQEEPLGLGHAILQAKSIINKEPFAVILADDLIDFRGDSKIAGKKTGKDHKKGKATLISLFGYENAVKYCDKIIFDINKSLKKYGSNSNNIRETLDYILNRDK